MTKRFRNYSELCEYCRNTGFDKSRRRKVKVWLHGSSSVVWELDLNQQTEEAS